MDFYKNKKNLAVGVYIPQAGFIANSWISVMNADTRELECVVGQLDSLIQGREKDDDFYRNVAENIEQANLYAKAPQLLEVLEFILRTERDISNKTFMQANSLIKEIKNIQEPAKRILGAHGYQVIQGLKRKQE